MLAGRLLRVGGGRGFVLPILTDMNAAMVYATATQEIAHDTETSMTFDSVEHDPTGYWSVSQPTRLTIPPGQGGVPFLLFAGSFTLLDPESDVILRFRKNGDYTNTSGVRGGWHTYPHVEAPGNPGQPVGYLIAGPTLVVPSAGDYFEFRIYIDTDGSSGTFGNATFVNAQTYFALVRLGV